MASYIQKIQLLTALKFYILEICDQRKTKDSDLIFLLAKSLVPREYPTLGQLCPFPAQLSALPIVIRSVCVWGVGSVPAARQNSAFCALNT